MTLTVVKVGGSLYDLPDLGARLRTWLKSLTASRILVVPGGGPTADVIREYDHIHALGEVAAHKLALRAMTLNAWFMTELLGGFVPILDPLSTTWVGLALLDAYAFCRHDEVQGMLPESWDCTSDSIAAATALKLGASELILLKSSDVAEGLLDPVFPSLVAAASLSVRTVNFRC